MSKVLCMEIGVSSTRIVEMDYQVKKPRVYRCIEVNTPDGAVKDGYLDTEKLPLLKEVIKEALNANRIRTRRVLFTIFSGRIINREVLIPGVKPHQINAVIESNITEYFPIELDAYKITHMLLKTFQQGENAGKHKVLVLAAEKSLLASYEILAQELGLRIVDIDYAGNGLLQSAKHNIGAEAVMVVKLEEENAIISIIQQGNLILQRNINHARGRMGNVELSIDDMVEALVNTMLRVIDFYSTGNENNTIEQIYIMGHGSKDAKLIKNMEEQLHISCRIMDTVRGVTLLKDVADAQLSLYAAVIGSGISSVGFDNEKEKERNETNYVSASILLIVFFVVAIAGILSMSLIPYNMAAMEEKSLQNKKESYAQAEQVYNRYQGVLKLYEQINYGNQLTVHSNDGILQFLEELENKMPSEIEMTEFASDDEQCVMTMRVADKETAAGVVQQLREFESLTAVTEENVIEESENNEDKATPGEGKTTISFTVTCTYDFEPPIPPTADGDSTEQEQQDTDTNS